MTTSALAIGGVLVKLVVVGGIAIATTSGIKFFHYYERDTGKKGGKKQYDNYDFEDIDQKLSRSRSL